MGRKAKKKLSSSKRKAPKAPAARPTARKTAATKTSTGAPARQKSTAKTTVSTTTPKKPVAARQPPVRPPVIVRPPVRPPVVVTPQPPVRPPVVGPPVIVGPPVVVGPLRPAKFVGNFFDSDRAGRPVVRPDDLLALRVELHNLDVEPGAPPRLVKRGNGEARLVLHFPPQAITEQVFFQAAPPGTSNRPAPRPGVPPKPEPGGSEEPTGPPIRARISGESRLAFVVPDGFEIEYTLAGLLAAVQQLPLAVAANARPPAESRRPLRFADIFTDLARLSPGQRAALTSFAARSLRIAAIQGDASTFEMRQAVGGPGLRPIGKIDLRPDTVFRPGPRPGEPGANETAIELPWRLIISPHGGERWRHATRAVISPAGRTELWHSRLVLPDSDGTVFEPPPPALRPTIRAVWALTGEGSPKPMQSQFPVASDLPAPNTSPFRMPLDDFDRFQIAHLSSNFSVANYAPEALDANLLMLSALGGWLDSRGAWDPPGLSVEEWVHRASMARDHYVRVVYKGFLFPFGHRVALIKVSERKFHNGAKDADGTETVGQKSGNTAYLRQRLFIIVRERERRFADPALTNAAGTVFLHRQFPFSSIRIVTAVTPNLDRPTDPASRTSVNDQRLFWPCVNGAPFVFECVGTDLDGRATKFGLPMIFMDNTMASPRTLSGDMLVPNFAAAESNAALARAEWLDPARDGRRVAATNQQRVAMAPSQKAGDTSIQAEEISFDAVVEPGNQQLRAYSNGLSRPIFYPKVDGARIRIPALAQLTGSAKTNAIAWNAHYLQHGFEANQGEVFVDIKAEAGMAKLDFSTQGDRSGGFVQPNLTPQALSRLTGPVSGNVGDFISGKLAGPDAFPKTLSDLPLPLLFGCIPLGDVIDTVTDLAGKPEQIPKFASEASTQVEQFINGLVRLFDFVSKLADQPGRLADAALGVAKSTLRDLLDQADGYAATLVADVKSRVTQLESKLDDVVGEVRQLFDKAVDTAPALPGLAGAIAAAQTAAANLRTAANASVSGVSVPSGLRQSLLLVATQVEDLVADLGTIATLIAQGKTLFAALDGIVGHPDQLPALLQNSGDLETRLLAVQSAMAPLRTTIGGFRLLAGAPRQTVLDAMALVEQVLGGATELLDLLKLLTGDELTIRFDWNPPISSWALPGVDASKDALFRVNDKRGFLVAVEAKVKKNGQSAPKISVVCSLKNFDLVLIAPASFIELNFEKIEFRIDSGAKMDVDVLLNDIKFVGPLSFVETLRDLIPLDGFSDPPFLDISPSGIDAGFSLALPNIAVGVFNLSNVSLGAGFTVPFIGQPLSVRFNFCTREQPFNLTVTLFGGGGFFAITLDPHGIQILEAAFEFGASISIDLGVASGGVHVMAGVYFRMEKGACTLAGYFRLGGNVSVLGIVSASLELYLELRYEFETGKAAGRASLTIEIEVFMFSASVTVTCERKFAGSNGDPTFRDLMGPQPALSLDDELAAMDEDTQYAWRDYCEAFA